MGIFSEVKNISLAEGLKLAEAMKEKIILDVRSEGEYAGGHLPNSINIPINRLPAAEIDKNTTIFAYCLSGARSARACSFLAKQGYENIYNMGGVATNPELLVK